MEYLYCLSFGRFEHMMIRKISFLSFSYEKKSRSATFSVQFAKKISKRSSAFSVQSVQLCPMTSQPSHSARVAPLGFFYRFPRLSEMTFFSAEKNA